tara:strand:+ start:73 stop:258 length:186 start_codon:yes stop_codon:yes gene_type:complete
MVVLNKSNISKKLIVKKIRIDIKPQYPKNPDIIIFNSFKLTSGKISEKLLNKINGLVHEKK